MNLLLFAFGTTISGRSVLIELLRVQLRFEAIRVCISQLPVIICIVLLLSTVDFRWLVAAALREVSEKSKRRQLVHRIAT